MSDFYNVLMIDRSIAFLLDHFPFSSKMQQMSLDQIPNGFEPLLEWLQIPSVSPDSAYEEGCRNAAQWAVDYLNASGLDEVRLYEIEGNPIVYAKHVVDPAFKTVLVYGHYDVQPSDPASEWTSDAFSPEIREGNLYGRGTADNKGQIYCHMLAVRQLLQSGDLKCNVVFLIEGEEECSCGNLDRFCERNKALLEADVCVISDSAMFDYDQPLLNVGLRGLFACELKLQSNERDLHSGVYGNAADNPLMKLSRFITELQDSEGKIQIPGFYEKIVSASSEELESLSDFFVSEDFVNDIGKEIEVRDFLTKTGYEPSLEIHGIIGGYIGDGLKTVIPKEASVKISFRLVSGQTMKEAEQQFSDYCRSYFGAERFEIDFLGGGDPWVADTTTLAFAAAETSVDQIFGARPRYLRGGGSIPIVSFLADDMGLEVILLGLALESNCIHAPDEHISIEGLEKGVLVVEKFYEQFAKI